jgi:hypothetical protein
MKGTCLLLVAALVAACGKSSKKQEDAAPSQGFAAAMKVICDAGSAPGVAEANPAERQRIMSEHIEANVTNPEARALFAEVSALAPAKASAAITDAARRAGLEGCAIVATSVAGRQVTITANAIVIEGHDVTPERVEPMIAALVASTGTKEVAIAIEPDVTYERVLPALQSIVRGGARPVLLDDAGGVPLAVPEPTPADPSAPQVEPEPEVGVLVMITRRRVAVASTSGLEGTIPDPVLSFELGDPEAAARSVGEKLTEIVDRRWPPGSPRSRANRQVIVLADPSTPTRVLLPILGAARRASDGRELFPDVALAAGIE